MRYRDIQRHLRPYSVHKQRRTTINHAFASAVAPCDFYDDDRVRDAIAALGQNADEELLCVYCGARAETWDHVHATVMNSTFSGFGHRLGNLLPCCKPCNSKKGNKTWHQHLESLEMSAESRTERQATISNYLQRFCVREDESQRGADHAELDQIKREVLDLLLKADEVANRLRRRSTS